MTALDDIGGRLTLTVPEAGALAGLGRDASYAAAEKGDLPARRVGRRLVVPTHLLLEQVLGLPPALIAQILGLPGPRDSGAGASTAPAATLPSSPHQELGDPSVPQ